MVIRPGPPRPWAASTTSGRTSPAPAHLKHFVSPRSRSGSASGRSAGPSGPCFVTLPSPPASSSSPTPGATGGTSRSRASGYLLLEPFEDGLQVRHVEVVVLVLEPLDEAVLLPVAQALTEPVERLLCERDDGSAVDGLQED